MDMTAFGKKCIKIMNTKFSLANGNAERLQFSNSNKQQNDESVNVGSNEIEEENCNKMRCLFQSMPKRKIEIEKFHQLKASRDCLKHQLHRQNRSKES